MGWKQWPYWLRGGVIFLNITLLVSIVVSIIMREFSLLGNWLDVTGNSNFSFRMLMLLIGHGFTVVVFFYDGLSNELLSYRNTPLGYAIVFFGVSAIHFALGAIIGLVIGKVKAKKNQSPSPSE